MPPRARPGERELLEKALTPSLRAALQELRVLLDVDDWQRSPLGPPFAAVAVLLRASVLIREGVAKVAALDRAAVELGISADTVRSRVRRWAAESRPSFRYAPCTAEEMATSLGDASTPPPPPEGRS